MAADNDILLPFQGLASPRHNVDLTTKILPDGFSQYVLREAIYAVPTKDLLDTIKLITFKKSIRLDKTFSAKVFLRPNVIRGDAYPQSQGEAELLLEMETKGKLFSDILSKVKTCIIQVIVQVREKGTGVILATHDDNFFNLSNQGITNCVCKLISAEELSRCNTRSVEICIETILTVEEWQDFSVKLEGDSVLISTL